MAQNPFDQFDSKAPNAFDQFDDKPESKPVGALRKLGDLGLSVAKGVIAVPEAAVGLADLATGGRAGKLAESAGVRFKDAKDVLSGFQSDDLKGKQQEFQQADGIVGKTGVALSNPSLIANAVAESVPSMGAGGVGARALMAAAPKLGVVGAGALGEGMVGAGSAAEQIRQQTEDGLLTGKQAALAGASGAATAAFGAAGGKVAAKLGIGDVDTMIANGTTGVAQTAAQANKGMLRRGAEGFLSEGVLEELPQSLSEQILQNEALGKDWREGLDEAAVMAVLSGGAMGAGAGVLTGTQARDTAKPGEVPPVAPPEPAGQLGYSPDPLISFPDGTVGRQAEVDAYVAKLPEREQMSARARLMGLAPQPATPAAEVAPEVAPVVPPSVQMGINPAAGVISAVAAQAVDSGQTQEIQLSQAAEQDQAVYEQAMAEQEQQAAEQDTADKPITSGPIADAQLSEEDKRAVLFGNEVVADGGRKFDGTLSGDILNGMGQPFATRYGAIRRANLEGKDWTIAPLFDGGWVARRKDATNGRTDGVSGAATGSGEQGSDQPAPSMGLGATDGAGTGGDTAGRGNDAVGESRQSAGGTDDTAVTPPNQEITPPNVQNTTPEPAGTQAQAAPVEAGAPAPSDAAPAEAVPGAGTAPVESAGVEQPKKPKYASKEDVEHLFGVDAKRKKAIERIAKGTAYFGTNLKAAQFIKDNGLKNTHEFVKTGATRYEVRAKEGSKAVDQSANTAQAAINSVATTKGNEDGTQTDQTVETTSKQSQERTPGQPVSEDQADQAVYADAAAKFNALVPKLQAARDAGNQVEIERLRDEMRPLDLEMRGAQNRVQNRALKRGSEERANAGKQRFANKAVGERVRSSEFPSGDIYWEKGGDNQWSGHGAMLEGKSATDFDLAERGGLVDVSKVAVAKPADKADDKPNLKKTQAKRKAAIEAVEAEEAKTQAAARADYFTPGNIVKSYGGQDEVLSYTPGENGGFSVKVHRVLKISGEWVREGRPQDARTHSTQPDARELAQGPIERLGYQPANDVKYSQPRADRQGFPNAVDRGAKPAAVPAASKPEIVVDKAEMRPYRKPDGSVGYEAVPIAEDKPAEPAKPYRPSKEASQAWNAALERYALANYRESGPEQRVAFGEGYMRAFDGVASDPNAKHIAAHIDGVLFFERTANDKPLDAGKPTPAPESRPKSTGTSTDTAPVATETVAVKANTVFTEDAAAAARARLKSKLNRLNSGIDPEMLMDGIILSGYHIEKGARTFAAYAKAMIDDLGDGVKPYLKSWYMATKYDPRMAGMDGLDSAALIDGFKDEDIGKDIPVSQWWNSMPFADRGNVIAKLLIGNQTPSTYWNDVKNENKAKIEAYYAEQNTAQPTSTVEKPADIADTGTTTQEEQANDAQGNDADYVEPLDNELPQGNPELAEDVAPETSGGLRDPNPAGDGRTNRIGRGRRTGMGRGEKPVLHGPAAEVRPLDNGPLNRDSDTPNQLPGGGNGNYQITEDDKIGEGSKGQKLRNNMAAIRTLRQIQQERRAATPDEQAIMAKFVGWGGLRELVDPKTTGKQWIEARAELLGTNGQAPLLVGGDKGEDWIALQRSTTAAHYTAPEIVKAMWKAAEHFGFTGGRALEPTSGIGNFIGLQPQNLAASTEWHGAELDTITGQLAKLIYPEAAIHAGTGFESVPFAKGAFDLAIGNPPFGSLTVKSDVPAYAHIPEMKIHNYIIAKTGEHLRPGGVMAMVVTHRFLDTANPEAREHLAKSFKFLGAFRLPNDAFMANAGTEVVTDVIFLQKLREGEKAEISSWLDTEGNITVDGQDIRVNRYYENNPGNIFGKSSMQGTLYRGDGTEYTVNSDGRDISKAMADLLEGNWAYLKDVAKPTNADQDIAAVMLTQSDLPIGGVVLDESGKVMKREMDDEAGNAVIKEVTPETLWKDGAEQWQGIDKAAKALRNGKEFTEAAKEFVEASAIAYSAKGEKRPKPTKAEQAVYDIRDSLDAPAYQWSHDEQLAEIGKALSRKKLGNDGYQVLKGLLGLRTATLKLITAEIKSAPDMEDLRTNLNKVYAAFVAEHGYVSDPANANLLDGDVGVESGLESGFRPKNGKNKASANKSDIFSQRVNFPYKEITTAKDAADGLQISMSERGRLDIGYISGLTGQSKAQVITELSTGESPSIFFDPATNEYEDADSYLSGNVKRKLDEARANGLKANIAALEAVQPTPKTRDNVKPNIRGSWMPESVFEQFLTDIGVQSAQVNIIASQGMILARPSQFRETEFGAQFKSGIKSVVEIFNSAASGKPVTIWVESSDGKRVKNEAATKEVNLLVERMAKVFEEWAYANDDRINSIVEAFNEKMNTHIARKYDGNKYLKTVGANPSIVLRTTQKNAAWRMVQADTVLHDHVVGAGKTFTMITGVKERKRLGLSRKPLIVVPNHLVTQWAKDFYALYPGAKVLAATPDDFSAKKRKRMFSRIATGDYDAVIIGHSSMGFIPAPLEDQQRIINENISELQEVLNELRAKKESGRTITQIQERLQKYEGKLKDLMDSRKDDIGLDLETMGIDYIAVDEMHEFKNLEYSSAGERVVGMNDPKGSKKAFDLYIKIRGILARGGAVAGATGTPVSNSLVELYTMMKYLAYKDLTERSQSNFDAWSGAYTRTENKLEYTATQKLKPRRVLAGLNNLSALKQVYESFADVISMDDLKRIYSEDVRAKNKKLGTNERTEFPVPKVEGGKRVLDAGPITQAQSLYMDYLVARMNAIEQNKSNKEYASIDNALYVLTDARKMSLDIRIVDPTAPRDENGKVARAAERIKGLYDKWDAYKGTQMVFCDLSTPAKNAVKEAKAMIRDGLEKIVGEKEAKRIKARVEAQGSYINQWRYIESLASDIIDNPQTDPEVADKTAAYLASLEDVDATMTTADVGFSVYDDLRQVLIDKGIPEREIAFIHDYNTPEQKAKLFQAVNDGEIRVLLGSSAKMGAGTNAQQRLIGLHHMDAPWRPSDVEQREGRIIRQGNNFYGAIHDFGVEKLPADIRLAQAALKAMSPNGFEVSITAYSTNGTSDAVMWQVLERKAKAIEEFRSTEMDSTDEDEGDANQYAEFMAQSTGNPVFKLKLEAEREVDLLDAETRGVVLAKSQAKQFMANYDRDLAGANALVKMAASANVDSVSVGKESGTAAEFNAAMAAADAKYTEEYAKYLEKKEEANKALDAWNAQLEMERGDKPKMPTAPAKPGPMSKQVLEGSGYARAIKTALEKGTVLGNYEFKIGNVELRVRKSPMHETFWFLDIQNGKDWQQYTAADAIAAENSANLARALMPDVLMAKVSEIGKSGQWSKNNLESQRDAKEKLANRDIGTEKLEKAKKVAEWYKAQVGFAEQQADEIRGRRMNSYIAGDSKRPLQQFKSEPKEAKSVEFEGETYNLTGYGTQAQAQATDKSGNEVLVQSVSDKDGWTIKGILPKPAGVDFSGIKKPGEAPALSRTRPTFSRGAQVQANESVETVAMAIASKWENTPEIIVAFDMNDPIIPEAVRKEDQRQRSGGATGTPEGFYYKGQVYLMSSKLGTANDIARVLFHETLGHYGLRSHFGKEMTKILKEVATLRRAEVNAKMEQYGLKGIKLSDRLIAAEEVLAELAQTRPEIGFVKRAIAAVRTWLRQNVPGFASLRLSDAELIRSFIIPARQFVENGGGPKGGVRVEPRFSRGEDQGVDSVKVSFDKDDDGVIYSATAFLPGSGNAFATAEANGNGTYSITESGVPEQMRGQGKGVAIYDALLSDLFDSGVASVSSDNSVSADAQKIYAALERRGYVVTRNPSAKEGSSGALEANGPVFTVASSKAESAKGFKRWFGDSKVVDADGKPLVVYHGAAKEFTEFRKRPGTIYFAEHERVAKTYGENVMPVYLSISNPLDLTDNQRAKEVLTQIDRDIDDEPDFDDFTIVIGVEWMRPQIRKWAIRKGYDGLILPTTASRDTNVIDGKAYVAFRPEQIKSATGNNGDFDPENADIRFSRTLGETVASAANNIHDVSLPAGYTVGDFFKSAPGKLSWWHKTVGTMYDLAQRSPEFKRVFDGVQNFINDVSYYATEAADLAPNILPKLESWKDVTKSPLSPEDTKAISAPIFEGTLTWARDESGKPIEVATLEAQAKSLTLEQKAQRLLRNDKVDANVLKMWQGKPIEEYEAIIEGKYERDMLKAGIVWTPAELRQQFKLTGELQADGRYDGQIGLYQEFRKATDKSLTNLAISDMLRFGGKDTAPIRERVLAAANVVQAGDMLRDYLMDLSDMDPDRKDVLLDTANKMVEKSEKAKDLIERGYAPLSRYGQYTLDVVSQDGERVYFGMFESKMDAARMARRLEQEYPGATMTRGTVSEEEYKLFAGVSPETLELFGDMLGLEAQGDGAAAKAFQTYLKLAKSNRSSMKRMIQRKGIAGFSEDSGRVLAGFVYSNARQTASNLHMGEMTEAANEVSKKDGELKDQAVRLVDYVKNPREEAQAFRGLLFAQYIGGSIASAMVNMTQPLTMTFPWLSQYGTVADAAKQMTAAMRDANKKLTGDARLDAALKRAEEDGTVSPQEVHQLQQQSQGRGALQSGDGTRAGNAMAAGNNFASRVSLGWGKLFGLAEQFNRRATFIAAYRMAVANGMKDPDAFARKAIAETQGVYNKGNKPAWARGAVGSTLFTFKQYSIAYMEMLHRMYKSGPEGKKAALLALAVLFLMSGAGGLPGSDDLDDLISGLLQRLGYNFDTKAKRKEFFASMVGEGGAQFLETGISGLPGMPLDVSGRLGMGNLIPGTGVFQKKADYTRDVTEIAGPAGDFVKRGFDAAGKVIAGDVLGLNGAVRTIAPKAVQNLYQSYDMASMGMYRDAKGMKVLDTDGYDAALKAIGFQPNDVKKVQDASFETQRMIGLNKLRETEIANRWALGIFEKDPDMVRAAREELREWNETNADSPIRINFKQILQRVQKMNQSKTERIAATAPKEIRNDVRKSLALE